jgi:hypothetical protein
MLCEPNRNGGYLSLPGAETAQTVLCAALKIYCTTGHFIGIIVQKRCGVHSMNLGMKKKGNALGSYAMGI